MIYMFCYDVVNDRRRQKIAKTLESFGIRVQKSFFQCEMEKSRMEELRDALLKHLRRKEDSLFVYPQCEDCSREVWRDGDGEIMLIRSFEIL